MNYVLFKFLLQRLFGDILCQLLHQLFFGFCHIHLFGLHVTLSRQRYSRSCWTGDYYYHIFFQIAKKLRFLKYICNFIFQGPGLVFEVYPEAIATLPGSQIWSCLFFVTMIMLGMDSAVSIIFFFFSSWNDSIWPFNLPFSEKLESQREKLYGFCFSWTDSMCVFKLPFWAQL